jgi:pimeloyl-ACP methyl ester carboxylesterase
LSKSSRTCRLRRSSCAARATRIVPRGWADEVIAALPNGRLAEVPDAPHAVNYAAPDALTRLTLEFLEEPIDTLAAWP